MDALAGVKVGDVLRVFGNFGRARNDGYEVTVTKVGRKLVTIEEYGRPVQYRIENGYINDGFGHSRVETAAGTAQREAVEEAVRVLRALGLEVRSGRSPGPEKLIEIADRLRDLVPEGD